MSNFDQLPTTRECHFCGSANPMGYKIRYGVDRETGLVRGQVEPPATSCGFPGILHGGLQGAMLDDAMWWAVAWEGRASAVTLNMNITFEKTAKLGGVYTLEAEVSQRDRRKVTSTSRVIDPEGVTVCSAEGLYLLTSRKKFERILPELFNFDGCNEAVRRQFTEGE